MSAAAPRPVRTDLAVVRAVLDDLARGVNGADAARAHGVPSAATVTKWRRRAAATPGWPTAVDIAEQAAYRAAHADRLAARRSQEHAYRTRVYVQRGPMHVDLHGTARRLRALLAIGYTQRQLAVRLGVTNQRVSHLVTEHYDAVHRDVAARVAALYDELAMVVPQDLPPGQRPPRYLAVHERQRRQIAAKGWPPPLAWDDDSIDDPDAVPAGWLDPTTTSPAARRAAVVRDLVDDGADLWEVLRRIEMTRNAFQTWCTRHGFADTYRDLAARAAERAGSEGNQHTRRAA